MDDGPGFLTIPAVSRAIDCSEKTVRRAIRSGALPAAMVLGRYRIATRDAERWAGIALRAAAPSDSHLLDTAAATVAALEIVAGRGRP